jgi:hypothetical protein
MAPLQPTGPDAFSLGNALFFAQVCQALYLPESWWRSVEPLNAVDPIQQVRGSDDTHCVVVSGDDFTLLAFRGTGPISVKNWLADDDVQLVDQPEYTEGLVHQGFAGLLDNLWTLVTPLLTGGEVWVTGHSLGGALATLAAARLEAEGRPPRAAYTFGSPRVGDAAFARSYRPTLYRFVYHRDVLPHLPLQGERGYTHVGFPVQLSPGGGLARSQSTVDPGDSPNDVEQARSFQTRLVDQLLAASQGKIPSFVFQTVKTVLESLPNPEEEVEEFFNRRDMTMLVGQVTRASPRSAAEDALGQLAAFLPAFIADHFPRRYVNALKEALAASGGQ